MNLDNLHKVMKGDMTIDQACEGMTDDYEIGHVSHRADGDYRKVAQGKWVPVKAAGQAREFSETENHGAQLERQKKADAQARKDEAVREQRAQGEAVGKAWQTAAEEWMKKNPNYKEMSGDDIIKGISEHIAASEKPAARSTNEWDDPDDFIDSMVDVYEKVDGQRIREEVDKVAKESGWDAEDIMDEVERRAALKRHGLTDGAPRLTRDTKIKLSQVKR